MNLKKILIACIAGLTITITPILSSVATAATSCPICGEIVRKGENHTHRTDNSKVYETQGRGYNCRECGEWISPGRPHKCVYY